VIFDRIELGTYVIASTLLAKKNLTINKINPKIIKSEIDVLKKIGVKIIQKKNSIIVKKGERLKNINIATKPYPGIPTDLQAQLMVLLTQVNGVSKIKENIFENRFMHVQELARFGANIKLKGDTAFIRGVKEFNSAPVMATDLRASASLIIAALSAKGKSTIRRIYHLDRGFDKIENKLRSCGAKIQRKRD
jgi:UDP-N-acetylglucosamine 1-carboxyvinyltransferase